MRTLLLGACGWGALGLGAGLKLPQVVAVLRARSVRGLSLPGLLLELAGFLVCLRYQSYYEYPPLTYLEYPVLIAQDVVLLLCVFHFNGNVKRAAPYVICFVAAWFLLTLHKWIIDLAMRGQQVRSAPAPVGHWRLGIRERSDLGPGGLHQRGKNSYDFTDHR
ncbi:solute carrier family 66 member 3 isoform X4 [Erinaceus europaeus]|uniref:Solute carrier family 66 member 3 isoform X4 n=1 Tax=Erinaceus europaeus TaxID=9365 RepID=A0ABM3X146_ERIEU|nr:solute carrier family 66 member 3 isoform X4 [Erinaceus europaeus]